MTNVNWKRSRAFLHLDSHKNEMALCRFTPCTTRVLFLATSHFAFYMLQHEEISSFHLRKCYSFAKCFEAICFLYFFSLSLFLSDSFFRFTREQFKCCAPTKIIITKHVTIIHSARNEPKEQKMYIYSFVASNVKKCFTICVVFWKLSHYRRLLSYVCVCIFVSALRMVRYLLFVAEKCACRETNT